MHLKALAQNRPVWVGPLDAQTMKRFGGDDHSVGEAIHAVKEYGLGGADDSGLDPWGGMWSKSGDFLGFIMDFF